MHEPHRESQARSAYVKEQVINDNPLGLVARLYHFAHTEARRARTAIEQDNRRTKAQAISQLLRAIALLQGSLNMEAGGEVALNLDRLYSYIIQRISTANVHDDGAAAREVESYLADLAQAWTTVARRDAVQAAP